MEECVNDWEESSHGRWGYVKAQGSCCDPGSLRRAVSAGERETSAAGQISSAEKPR